MRILHVIHSLRRGGAERIALSLARGMAQSYQETAIVSLLDKDDYADTDRSGFQANFLIPAKAYRWPSSCCTLSRKLRTEIERFVPDVILSHTPTATIVLGIVKPSCRIFSVFHGFADNWKCEATLKQRVFRTLHRWALRRTGAGAIVVSKAMAPAARTVLGMQPQRIFHIRNGIDLGAFYPNSGRSLARAEILVVGTLSEVKRPLDAIEAFARLLSVVPEASLAFVGDGPLRREVEERVSCLGLGQHVRLFGQRQDVPDLLRRTSLVWQLSRSEGMSLACIEAMASGVPVIATRVGGIPEVIVDGQTGYLVDLGDIASVATLSLKLLEDGDLYSQMSAAGVARATDRFSRQEMVRAYIECAEGALRPLYSWEAVDA